MWAAFGCGLNWVAFLEVDLEKAKLVPIRPMYICSNDSIKIKDIINKKFVLNNFCIVWLGKDMIRYIITTYSSKLFVESKLKYYSFIEIRYDHDQWANRIDFLTWSCLTSHSPSNTFDAK